MQEGFEKFKKKFHIHAIVKSVLFGVSIGILAASVLVTVLKLSAIAPNPLWYLLCGVAAAVLFGFLAYIILRPTDKRVAKKLDEALGLGEKVQTMVAYREQSGLMIEVQRYDTQTRLSQTPIKSVKTGKVWRNIFAPSLAIAMAVVAIFTPLKVVDSGANEPVFELSSWQETRLENLIEEVKASGMEETPKGEVVVELEKLLDDLAEIKMQALMKTRVIATIKNVNTVEKNANSVHELADALSQSSDANVKKLAAVLQEINVKLLQAQLTETKDTLAKEQLKTAVGGYKTALALALNAVNGLQTDSLCVAIRSFVDGLDGAVNGLDGLEAEQAAALIDGAFAAGGSAIEIPLKQQEINVQTTDMVVRELMYIFGVSANELPQEERPGYGGSSGDSSSDDTSDKGDDGGLGGGEIVYGSNDQIYCPDKGAYVSYGEVLNAYFGRVEEQIRDGNTPETLEQFIREYFDALY